MFYGILQTNDSYLLFFIKCSAILMCNNEFSKMSVKKIYLKSRRNQSKLRYITYMWHSILYHKSENGTQFFTHAIHQKTWQFFYMMLACWSVQWRNLLLKGRRFQLCMKMFKVVSFESFNIYEANYFLISYWACS